jgi:hypothetical protein
MHSSKGGESHAGGKVMPAAKSCRRQSHAGGEVMPAAKSN